MSKIISNSQTGLRITTAGQGYTFLPNLYLFNNFGSNKSSGYTANLVYGYLANIPYPFLWKNSMVNVLNPSGGGVLTASLGDSGGSGYAPGDTGNIDSGNGDAVYVVNTVDGNGAVLTFHLSSRGSGYSVSSNNPTVVISGGGDSALTINVLTLSVGFFSVGLYDLAGNRLVHTGAVDGSVSGNVISTVTPYMVQAGAYLFCWTVNDASLGLSMSEGFDPFWSTGLVGLGSLNEFTAANPSVSGVLPATLGLRTTISLNNSVGGNCPPVTLIYA